jgi:DDE family transposase
MGSGRRARRWTFDGGPGFHGVRGPRPPQGRGRLRLHPTAWLPPAAGHQGRHRRGAAVRMRTGRAASGRGAERFVNELAGRVRRAGASGQLVLRADSGFWSAKVLAACRRHHIRFSVTVRQTATVRRAIAAIAEAAWTDIDYTDGGVAQVAETTHGGDRLIVRVPACWARRPPCGPIGATRPLSPTVRAARSAWTPTIATMPSANWPSASSRTAPGCATAPPGVSRQCRLAGAGRLGAQPAGVGGGARARRTWPGGSQDPAASVCAPARPTHPLGPPAAAPPASGLAMGRGVPGRP